MKTILQFSLIVMFIFCSIKMDAQKKEAPPDTAAIWLEINAGLTIDFKEASDFSYCLHHGGEQIDSAFVKRAKTVSVPLKRNDIYTLSFHKDGFDDKYVVIDTHVPRGKAKQEYYEIAFEIELKPEHGMHKEEYKDHPVAVVKYFKSKDDFDYSTKYTDEIHHKEKTKKKSKK